MKNFRRFAVLAAALMLALTACGGNKEKETEAAENESALPAAEDLGSITKLGNYIGVKLTAESTEVTDEELDAIIQDILDSNPEYVEVTRAARDGDRVNIDFVGLMDGEEFDGGSSENYYLTLGSGDFIDGFEDGLIGAKAGDEVSLELTFPEAYYEELAGQDVVFNVTVNTVEEVVPAVLDDDFVQRMSDFTTVDEFTDDLKEQAEEYKELLSTSQLQRDALQAVVDASTFDLNQDYLEEDLEYNMSYVEYMASMYGMELDDFITYGYGMTTQEFEDYCREMVGEQMEQSLVVDAIFEKENMELTQDDLQYTADILYEDLDSLMENDPQYLEANATAYKVADFIIQNADIKVVSSAVSVQDDDEEKEDARADEAEAEDGSEEETE